MALKYSVLPGASVKEGQAHWNGIKITQITENKRNQIKNLMDDFTRFT